jgi:tetratricopeptide (TPR) repeat protein
MIPPRNGCVYLLTERSKRSTLSSATEAGEVRFAQVERWEDVVAAAQKRPTSPRKKRSRPRINLKHPFRAFYLGIVFLLANLVAAVVQALLSKSPDLQDTFLWGLVLNHPVPSAAIAAVCVALGAIGWYVDHQTTDLVHLRQTLPLARELRATSLKLGDDVAAQTPYIKAPVQHVYQKAVNALHDASTHAPGAKSGLLVMGVANAGKTRLALEVVKEVLPNWRVFIWRVDANEPNSDAFEGENVVIFIDDLQDHAPAEIRYTRGASQTLDTRALALQKMMLDVRGWADQVIVVATCRSEDEVRTRARMGWLFTELASVEVPQFPLQGPEAEAIINAFRAQALQRINDWDGTLGSPVLGLSAKGQSYAELVTMRDPAAYVLQAMKLLTLAGVEQHTERRLRKVCTAVFFRTDLEQDDVWRETVGHLVELQFVTEGPGEGTLIIRKDSYFEQVVTDYPAKDRPLQLGHDLERCMAAFVGAGDAEAIFHLGNTFYRMRQYIQSLEAYEHVLKIGVFSDAVPASVIWRNKGAVLQSQKQFAQALDAYDQALRLDPKFVSAWRNRGDIQLELGDLESALGSYERALQIEPRYVAALNSRARALNAKGSHEETLGHRDQAVGYREQALDLLEEALHIDPEYDFAWRDKGDVLQALKRFDQALDAYDHALKVNPGYAYAWNGKGVVFRETGDTKNALAAFDQALEIEPKLWYAWNGRGSTLRDLGQYEEALMALDRALQLNPSYGSALKNLGTVLEKLGRYDEALSAFGQALVHNPSYPAAFVGRATVLADQGRYMDAVNEFDRALQADPSYVTALEGSAQVWEKLGRLDTATDLRNRARNAMAAGSGTEPEKPPVEDRPDEQVQQLPRQGDGVVGGARRDGQQDITAGT